MKQAAASSPRSQKTGETPAMPAPLSELLVYIPVKDMKAWVHRSLDGRMAEFRTRGKIPRPINSFMLYRMAIEGRAKQYLGDTNSRLVSLAAGGSWKIEPARVRKFYSKLAEIEQQKHASARRAHERRVREGQLASENEKAPQQGRLPSTLSDYVADTPAASACAKNGAGEPTLQSTEVYLVSLADENDRSEEITYCGCSAPSDVGDCPCSGPFATSLNEDISTSRSDKIGSTFSDPGDHPGGRLEVSPVLSNPVRSDHQPERLHPRLYSGSGYIDPQLLLVKNGAFIHPFA